MSLTGQDIVCFANDWDGDPLSKTHLMRLAARENRVLWVSSLGNRAPRPTGRDARRIVRKLGQALAGVREVEPNLFVISPVAVPLYGARWAREVNARLVTAEVRLAMRRLGMRSPIAVSFLPSAAPAFDRLGARLKVYYCVDDFGAFSGAGEPIARLERELIAKSDLVICSAASLRREKAKLHPRVELVRHGVDFAHFSRSTSADLPVDERIRRLARPVLGFVGLVAEWIDQDLLAAAADRFPSGTLVVVGREDVSCQKLRARGNVVFLGRRPYAELPAILKGFDVALCPFVDSLLSRAANPLKVREYLAAGLPVVATPIPEVRRLGLCHIGRDAGEFVAAIDAALAAGGGPSEERSRSMRSESWEARWGEVSALIERGLAERVPERRSA